MPATSIDFPVSVLYSGIVRLQFIVSLFACWGVLGGGASGRAQDVSIDLPPNVSVQSNFEAAQQAEAAAKTAETDLARKSYLQKAVDQYMAAVQAGEHVLAARLSAAQCLVQLVPLALTPEEKVKFIDAARNGLTAVTQSEVAGARELLLLASFLTTYDLVAAKTPEERRAAAASIAALYRRAIAAATNDQYKNTARLRLGALLVGEAAELQDERAIKQTYTEAETMFSEVDRTAPEAMPADARNMWGVAMLHVGRLTQNRDTLERAMKLLEEALANAPRDLFRMYNLACAHALLGNEEAALRLLRGSLDLDRSHVVFQAALTDAEWNEIRDQPGFQQLRQSFDPRADAALREGLALQSSGERAGLAEVRADYFTKAIQHYNLATEVRPNFYAAHYNALICLRNLFTLAGDPASRLGLLGAIQKRFAAAASSTGAEWQLYRMYGRLLINEGLDMVREPAQRLGVLQEARRALEEGLNRASFSGERARLENDLGTCKVFLAREIGERKTKRKLFDEAIQHFRAAVEVEDMANTPDVHAAWGVAQLELAKLQQDRFGLRQAIERFKTALASDPKQLLARYNLACTYALLGRPTEAMQELELCLSDDTQGKYVTLAGSDPDFESIRSEPRFKQMLAQPTYGRPVYVDEAPSLSGE